MVNKKYQVIFLILTLMCLLISFTAISAADNASDSNTIESATDNYCSSDSDLSTNVENNAKIGDKKTINVSNDSTNYIEKTNTTYNDKTIKTANVETSVTNFDELKNIIESAKNKDTLTLTLDIGTYTITSPITINKRIIVIINGNGQTINGNNNQFIKITENKAELTISNITVSNCKNSDGAVIYSPCEAQITVTDSTFSDNSGYSGGVIYSKGIVTSINSTFKNNVASYSGGAIWHAGNRANESVNVINSTFTANNATQNGGAIFTQSHVLINNSQFINNNAIYNGGAIYTSSRNSIVRGSTFENNSAKQNGGAIWHTGASSSHSLTVINSTFNANNASQQGGAISTEHTVIVNGSTFNNNSAQWSAGAIYAPNRDLTITDSSFENNNAQQNGGAVVASKLSSVNNTFTNNTSGWSGGALHVYSKTTIENTAFKDNHAEDNGGSAYIIGELNVNNSVFINNTASESGGSLYSFAASSINNSKFYNNTANHGGAIYSYANEENNILENTVFESNSAENGGCLFAYTNYTINNVTFTGNNASFGGAIYNIYSLSVDDTTFDSNTATKQGGAIYSQYYDTTINNSNFTNNKVNGYRIEYLVDDFGNFIQTEEGKIPYDSTNPEHEGAKTDYEYYGDGGAIFTTGDLTSVNNSFINNSAMTNGGAIYTDGNYQKNVIINNNTFINNNVTQKGGALYSKSSLTINDSVFNDNNAKNNKSDSQFNDRTYGGSAYTTSAVVIGNSSFNNSFASMGGAVYVSRNLTSINNTFTNNNASVEGGAVYGSVLIINDTILDNNRAFEGGAVSIILNMNGSNINFTNNCAENDGGALIITYQNGNLTLNDCMFLNNSGLNGGAIRSGSNQSIIKDNTNVKLSNTTFDNNNGYRGAAIYLLYTNMTLESSNITNNVANISSTVATYHSNVDINDTLFENNTGDTIGLTLSEYSNITINNSKMVNNTGNKSSIINSMNSHIEIHDSELINNSGNYGVVVSHATEHYYYGYMSIDGCNLTGNIVTIELDNDELNWHYNVVRSEKSSYSENYIEVINNTFRNNTNFKHGMLFGDFADYYVTNNTYISNYLEVFDRNISQSIDKNDNYVANVTLKIRDVCNSSVDNSKLNVYVDNVLYKQFNVHENQSTIVIDKDTMDNMKSDSIRLEFFSPRLDYHGFNWTVTLPQKINVSITANNTKVGKHVPINAKIQTADGHVISSVNATLVINQTEIPVEFDRYGLLEYNDYIPKTDGLLNISIRYNGDKLYFPAKDSTTVTVSEGKTILDVNDIHDTYYNSTVTVSGNLSTAQGPIRNTKINLTINGDVKEVNVDENGHFEYKFKSTKLGENKVLVSYPGDEKNDESNYLLKFNTKQLDSIIEYNITNYTSKNEDENDYTFKYSQMLILNGTLKDIRGNPITNASLDVNIDGYKHKDLYPITTNDKGEFNYTRRIRYMEDKNLTVSFNGNTYYKSANASSHISVIKMGTKLTLLPIPYIESNTSCYLVVTLEDEEGKPIENFESYQSLTLGYLNIRINNTPLNDYYKGDVVFVDQLTKYRFAGSTENLSEGNYTVHAVYTSSYNQKYYETSEDEFVLQVISGLSQIAIDEIPSTNRTLGDPLTVSGTLKDRHGDIIPNTNVSIFVNAHEHNASVDENGRFSITIPIIEANTNHIRVSYEGNDTYTPASATTTVEVNKSNTTLELYTDRKEEVYGDKLLIYGWLKGYDGSGRKAIPLKLEINIFEIDLETDENGYYEYWTTTRFVGVNNVTVTVKETEDYKGATNKTTFIMKRRDTNIILNVPDEMTIGEETVINGTLSGLYGKIKNNKIDLYINNGKYYVYTDDNGDFFLPYKATSYGIKNVTAIFEGDEQRLNSSTSKQINVVKINTKVTLTIDNYKPIYGENITISGTLTDENGNQIKNGNVDLIINGKTHTLKVESTNQFHHTHHVTTSGLNNISVKFVETGIYTESSTNSTFTVNKTDVVLLMTQSQKKVELNDNLTINGIMIDNKGHAIENAKLLLTINNKNVTLTTASEGYFYYRTVEKTLGKFTGKISHLEEDSFNPASVEFTYTVVEKLSDEDTKKVDNTSKIIKSSKSKNFKIAQEYQESIREVIFENHNTTGYNFTEVFPHNTTVTIHEVIKHLINTNVTVISKGTPIYYEDGFMAYCIDRYRAAPIDSVIYSREEYEAQDRINNITTEDVVKYLKTFIITHLGDNYNFTNEHQKQDVIWGFTDFSYRTQLDGHYNKVIVDADGNPHSITEYINETIELVEAGHIPANQGIIQVGTTLYNYYFAYGHPDEYVADQEYQRTFGIYLYPLPLEFAWGFVVKNESTVENATEVYSENITELEEYDEIVEYNDTEEIIVPYNETVNVTVEHTREVPYNETVNVTKNITVTVPYIEEEEYTVNVNKTVPYTVEEEYTENVTRKVPYTVEEEYKVNVTKEVPYTELEEYIENITKQIPYTVVENYTVNITKIVPYTEVEEYTVDVNKTVPYTKEVEYTENVTKQVPYTVEEAYTVNETKLVPYTELEEYIENVTKTVNYTVEENYTVNKTVNETYNKTIPVVKNRTITVPEIRYRNVTKYKVVTEPVIKYHNVTKYKTVTEPVIVYKNVTENRTVTVPEVRYRNVTKTKNVTEAVTKYRNVTKYKNVTESVTKTRNVTKYKTETETITKTRNVTKYETVTEPVTKYRNVTKTKTVTEPEIRYRNITKYNTTIIPETKYRNVTKTKTVTEEETRIRNVTKTRTETETITKTRNVTKYNTVTVPEIRYRNVTKYKDEVKQVTEEVTQTKYKNETYTEVVQKTVTKNRTETITVPKTKTYHYSRPVTHAVTKYRPYSYNNFKYKLYIYILYLNGNITFDDLVAVLGEENIQFNENGEIVLEYDDTINIPNYIQIRKSDNYTGEEDIPSTGDNIRLENPNKLDEPIMDAGVVDVID